MFLDYSDFSSSVSHRPSFDPSIHMHDDIFSRIIHPYNANAFEHFLQKHDLSRHYPLLVNNLHHGFPLGNMPEIRETIIIPNNRSFTEHADAILEYLRKEVASGRMSGPFTRDEVEKTLRGPFISSPIIAVVQPQPGDTPDKIRICRHLSKSTRAHPSVNSFISKDDFPTRFDTASKVADIVSLFFHYVRALVPCTKPSRHRVSPASSRFPRVIASSRVIAFSASSR